MFKNSLINWLVLSILVLALVGVIYLVSKHDNSDNLTFVDVGWWNIRDFSTSSRDELEIAQIADIINTDVMAIGELNDTWVLELLTAKLVASDHRPIWIKLKIPDEDDD